jgi:hypothetical protein
MAGAITIRAMLLALVSVGVALPRPPSFQYVDAVGCGDLVLMAWNKESSEVLSITLAGTRATEREARFDLTNSTKAIQVRVDAFEGPESFRRCGDLGPALTYIQDPTSGWLAVSGRVKLRVDRRRSIAAVEVQDLVVQSIKGDRVRANKMFRFTAPLHGMAG